MNDLNNNFDTVGAPDAVVVDTPTPSAEPIPTPAPDPVPPSDSANEPTPQPAADDNAAQEKLLAEFDEIDAPSAEQKSDTDASASSLSPDAAAQAKKPISGDAPQSQDEKPEKPDGAQTSEGEDIPELKPDADATADDWEKNTPEEEKHIKDNLPKSEWKNAQKAFRNARMAQSFLNPNAPVSQWLENLEKKSAMRFGEVETAILKRHAEKDPVEFLGKIFEVTANAEGNSETYQRLLENVVTTNTDYVLDLLKQKGFEMATAGEKGSTAGAADSPLDTENLTDAEIDEFQSSAVFAEMQDAYPEKAESLKKILDGARSARAELDKTADERAKFEASQKTQQTEKQKAADLQKQQAQADQQKKQVETFNGVYEETVTTFVDTQLDTRLGLGVTPDEKEKNPMMAFLKEAKRTLIKSGGMNGSGDFDNDLYEWGKTRPAFMEASKAMIAYTKAGEVDNAKTSGTELRGFAEMFLNERVKLPEIALVDELIQIVARDQAARNDTRHETVPNSIASAAAAGGQKTILDEIDNIEA